MQIIVEKTTNIKTRYFGLRPYSKNVKTKIGETFFYLLPKYFPKESQLYTLIDKSTLKLSYSSMPSTKRIIGNTNNSKLRKEGESEDSTNNQAKDCKQLGVYKNGCMANGRCTEMDIIYKATCTDQDLNERIYIGETADTFKRRCEAHYTTFNNSGYKNETALAKHIWDLQNKNITYQIHWETIEHANSFKPGNAYCKLCIAEKSG